MRVILTADVDSVGKMGEIKEVKSGMARNYLIPQKLAIRATPGNIKVWEQKSKILERREEGLRAEAQGFASKLDGASVKISVRVGEENKMFGSVTSQNISDALAEIGHEVSRKSIDLSNPIKDLGTHDIRVKLYQEVDAHISVEVEGLDADGNVVEIIEEEPEAVVEAQVEAEAEVEQEVETEEAVEEPSESVEEEESEAAQEVEASESESEEEVVEEAQETEDTLEEQEEPKE